MRTRIICAALLLSLLLLVGCQAVPAGVQLTEYQITSAEDGKSYAGLMGIPETQNCPVVFILHGAHLVDPDSPIPYYMGFEYLVQELANKGYLAISLDINNAYTGESQEGDEYSRVKAAFQASYEKLVLANSGKKLFPSDLKGKADLSRINMIGHSRGGENIIELIRDSDFKSLSFASALKIAASDNQDFRQSYTDIPTGLIYSQYDEDVVDSASANYYYYAYDGDKARNSPVVSAFLYGANHAAYNSLVDQDAPFDYGDVTHLDADAQRDFMKKFAVDFLSVYNHDENLFEVFQNQADQQYGSEFMLSIHDPLGNRILKPDEYKEGMTAHDVSLEYVVSSNNDLRNTAEAFNPTGNPEKLPLYKISWDKAGGALSIPIDSIFNEITGEKLLALYMALDSSDDKNSSAKPTAFDVVLTDQEGNHVSIPFSSATNPALKYQEGELVGGDDAPVRWRYLTPLGTELIRLNQWEGKLAADNIVSLEIIPTSATGSIMLGGIDVYNPALQ